MGGNLLEPGTTPHDNLKFVLFLTAVIRSVDRYQDLLRTSIATAGNDHRLGANEAPPAIISMYLGDELEEVVAALISGSAPKARSGEKLRLGVSSLPPLPRDTTDRNRTSPFAFTGNKFEFRALGSGQSIAMPNTILNTIVAESLDHLAGAIEAAGGSGDRREAIQEIVRDTLSKHQRILFSGDNYTEEWASEAERRGLHNFKDTPAALARLTTEANIELFERFGIFSARENQARANVRIDQYVHAITVEALATRNIGATSIPAGRGRVPGAPGAFGAHREGGPRPTSTPTPRPPSCSAWPPTSTASSRRARWPWNRPSWRPRPATTPRSTWPCACATWSWPR